MADGIQSIADKLIPSAPLPAGVQLNAVTDVGAVAEALAVLFKLTDSLIILLNSPQMLALRQNQDIQRLLNEKDADVVGAHKTGDLTQMNIDSSG